MAPPADATNEPSLNYADNAIDDSDDGDADFVDLQRTMSQKRRQERADSASSPIKKFLPNPFSPIIRPLTLADLESCVALEGAAFSEEFRASREKIEYRLSQCSELSRGLFVTLHQDQPSSLRTSTLPHASPVESERPKAVSVLLAHIISTRSTSQVVTDNDMNFPSEWKSLAGKAADTGHQETGRTIALHSLAVCPELHACGLGKMIMKHYLQQMKDAGMTDRVALLCQEYLVEYYERFGFKRAGVSDAQFGGGGWHNMVFDLPDQPKPRLSIS